jgi:hypothetical protein
LKIESGKWKVENGKWKMENGKWKVAPKPSLREKLKIESGEWSINLYSQQSYFHPLVCVTNKHICTND